jgi:uncharacterized protein
LFKSAEKDHIEIVRLLIAAKADRNKLNRFGLSPLLASVFMGFINIPELFINVGANLDQVDKNINHTTALVFSVQSSQTEISKLLVNAGANINHITSDKRSALTSSAEKTVLKL